MIYAMTLGIPGGLGMALFLYFGWQDHRSGLSWWEKWR